jgi:tetrahydromethanopterin S-methyltransferase subunit F
MKRLCLFILIIPNLCFSQIDTCKTYKELYSTSKTLNLEYKTKISKLETVILEQDSLIIIKNKILLQKNFMLRNDSLQFGLYSKQIKLLNENLSIYEKERDKQGKWHKRFAPGFIAGMIGSVLLINAINYSLPQ